MQLSQASAFQPVSWLFQSLKRDIPLCNGYGIGCCLEELEFQSLKRDIPLCNRLCSDLLATARMVSIAQARHPFMQLERGIMHSLQRALFQSLKRDIPLCNMLATVWLLPRTVSFQSLK